MNVTKKKKNSQTLEPKGLVFVTNKGKLQILKNTEMANISEDLVVFWRRYVCKGFYP